MINFNVFINLNQIVNTYETKVFPNAICLLWNHTENANLIVAENSGILIQQNSKGIEKDGTRVKIY